MMAQCLKTIHKEIQRLSGLNLFDLSKLGLGQENFYPSFTHMDHFLLEVLDSHSILLKENRSIDNYAFLIHYLSSGLCLVR